MKKITIIITLLLYSLFSLAQSKSNSIALGGSYITGDKIWAAGVHVMALVDNNFYIAPDISYYFQKTVINSITKSKLNISGINFNVNLQYALHLGNQKSFISPLAGLGGFVSWTKSPDLNGVVGSEFTGVANAGLAGRFNLGHDLFLNPQVKYMIPFKSEVDGEFSISCGLGLYF